MRTRILKTTIEVTALAIACAATARAADRCELFADPNFLGSKVTMNLPAVTATKAPETWANTSERFTSTQLGSLNDKTTTMKIFASESDVALYLLDTGDFNGSGEVFHCKKGRTCSVTLGTAMNDRASSAICQREFFRKSRFADPNVDPLLAYFTFLQNPVIDTISFSNAVDGVAQSLINSAGLPIDEYRSSNSEDGDALWSRSLWITKWDICKRNNFTFCQNTADKFEDFLHISKRFEIDLDGPVADLTIGLDDDYVLEADWYMRPVFRDQDGNPSTPQELRYNYFWHTIWVDQGFFHDFIYGPFDSLIDGLEVQTPLRLATLSIMNSVGCSTCVDGLQRLQMSIFSNANVGKPVWFEDFDMGSTHPKMALNTTRDAVYPD